MKAAHDPRLAAASCIKPPPACLVNIFAEVWWASLTFSELSHRTTKAVSSDFAALVFLFLFFLAHPFDTMV
jgi:hypothetical protein